MGTCYTERGEPVMKGSKGLMGTQSGGASGVIVPEATCTCLVSTWDIDGSVIDCGKRYAVCGTGRLKSSCIAGIARMGTRRERAPGVFGGRLQLARGPPSGRQSGVVYTHVVEPEEVRISVRHTITPQQKQRITWQMEDRCATVPPGYSCTAVRMFASLPSLFILRVASQMKRIALAVNTLNTQEY